MKKILSGLIAFALMVGVASAVSVHGADKNAYQQKSFILQGDEISVASATTNPITGGNLKLFDFPEGFLVIHGAQMDVVVTSTNLSAAGDAGVSIGIGTAANATGAGTLATTEENICTEVAMTGYTSGVTRVQGGITGAVDVRIDGSATAADLYLNVATTNALSATGDSSATVVGTVTITYSVLGDD
jgi:hypothetical protein